MPERMGYAAWPGTAGCVSCQYTAAHGTAPGVAALIVPESDPGKIAHYGNLFVSDGVGKFFLKNAKVVDMQFGASGSGRTITLHIADRRWRWRFGEVNGSWNQIDPYPDPTSYPRGEFTVSYGPYKPGTYRPAYKLMEDCLRALNETQFLIEDPPDVPVPADWVVENPAAALQAVCDAVHYRVVYQPCVDRVLVVPEGKGLPLPVAPAATLSAAVSLPPRSHRIDLVGGDTWYADLIPLEPVGRETDGSIKPINDLSYTPSIGWGACLPPGFGAVAREKGESAQALAISCIWKMFCPALRPGPFGTGWLGGDDQQDDHLEIAGFGAVYDRKQLILGGERVAAEKDATGKHVTLPAELWGQVYVPNAPGIRLASGLTIQAYGNTTLSNALPFSVAVDGARGLVTADRPLFYNPDNGALTRVVAPPLYLYTSFHVCGPAGLVPARFRAGGVSPATMDPDCPPETIHRPELVRVVHADRNPETWEVNRLTDNLSDLLPAADYYLRAADARYRADASQTNTYAGVLALDPDGAIQQVTWRVGGGQPATTQASRNTEHASYLPPYPERRRAQNVLQIVRFDTFKRNQAAGLNDERRTLLNGRVPGPIGE